MKKITLTNSQLKRVFEIAQSAISKDAARPIFQYAKATVCSNEFTSVSLDGYMLSRIKLKLSEPAEENFEFYYKPFALPKTLQTVEIEKTDDAVEFTLFCTEWKQKYIFSQPQSDFVDVEKIIPTTDESLTIVLDAKMLLEALKPLAKSPERHNAVSFNFVRLNNGIASLSPMIVTRKEDGISYETLILPLRCRD